MERGFATERTHRMFAGECKHSYSPDLQRAAWKKLAILHAAGSLSDLRVPPGNRLEKLTGQGQYSIRINDQWRICFSWRDGDAFEVEIVDYH